MFSMKKQKEFDRYRVESTFQHQDQSTAGETCDPLTGLTTDHQSQELSVQCELNQAAREAAKQKKLKRRENER